MTRRYLPALRGLFGDWAYYSCLMSLQELAERVSFAEEIHKSKALSDMFQRQLKEGRSSEIAQYLKTNPERFFNSLVVAVYGGDPAWHQLDEIKPQGGDIDPRDVSEGAVASIGFLSFTGEEKLFALDGRTASPASRRPSRAIRSLQATKLRSFSYRTGTTPQAS